SSTLGRWVQPDAIGFAGEDANLYRQLENNPTSFVDPSGYQKQAPKPIKDPLPPPKLPIRKKDDEKTCGVLRTGKPKDEEWVLISGQNPPAPKPKDTRGFTGVTQDHVEGHAAMIMHDQGLKKAILYINNDLCKACQQNIERMLPPGAELTVIVIQDGKPKPPKVYVGLPKDGKK